MEKLVFVMMGLASAAYVVALHLLLIWLSQFPWYPSAFNFFLFSLMAVVLGEAFLWWAEDRRDRHWATDIIELLLRPCEFYLGAIGSVLYLLALVVLAPFLLPFWLVNK